VGLEMSEDFDTASIPPQEVRLFLAAIAVSMAALCLGVVSATSSISAQTGGFTAVLWVASWYLAPKALGSLGTPRFGKWGMLLASRSLLVFLGVINGMTVYQASLVAAATLLTWSARRRMQAII